MKFFNIGEIYCLSLIPTRVLKSVHIYAISNIKRSVSFNRKEQSTKMLSFI